MSYVVMNEEQKKMANEAAEALLKSVQGMHPMAVFEALNTLVAQHCYMLDLNPSSANKRVVDRLRVYEAVGPSMGLPTLKMDSNSLTEKAKQDLHKLEG
jgi:hypothetical protein